ncbi:MAG: L-idonate 5-dehydrogenase [Ectothiorhodospiraceae bacterium]|nr:L-idonate 5-dehydrogenase [Ectothiorhodospiraceae bacterium]
MKAIVIHGPKDLRISDRAVAPPGDGQVLVDVGAGGICGSDLHYYHDGGFGTVRVREPMVLGHEVAGTVAAVGAGVGRVGPGDRIAINPSRPCHGCVYCREAKYNHCLNMRFYGSAMPFPHIQGAFQQQLLVDEQQCVPVGTEASVNEAALSEPFSVALHALRQAGPLAGKHVLVTGCGPIGALCAVAARYYGALTVTITDIVSSPLAVARTLGVDEAIDVAAEPERLERYAAGKGHFHVVVEASGAQPAIEAALRVIRPRGTLVQVGVGGNVTLPLGAIVSREVEIRGSFRFHEEFEWAASLIASRRVDLSPLISGVFPVQDAIAAFEQASDRARAMKVQIAFQ